MLTCGTFANVKVDILTKPSVISEVGYSSRISHSIVLNIVMKNIDGYHVFRDFSIDFHLSNLILQDCREPLCTCKKLWPLFNTVVNLFIMISRNDSCSICTNNSKSDRKKSYVTANPQSLIVRGCCESDCGVKRATCWLRNRKGKTG